MKLVTLADVSEDVRYGYTASATEDDTGVKFLRTTDIVELPVNWRTVPYCEPPDPKDMEKFSLRPGDIVVSRMGTVGVSAYVDPPVDAIFASYLVRFRINADVARPRYVAFLLRSQSWWDYVHAHKGGAVQPNLNAKLMKGFAFPLPTLDRQDEIVAVLGAIDDKVIANHEEAAVLGEFLDLAMEDLLPRPEDAE